MGIWDVLDCALAMENDDDQEEMQSRARTWERRGEEAVTGMSFLTRGFEVLEKVCGRGWVGVVLGNDPLVAPLLSETRRLWAAGSELLDIHQDVSELAR